MTSHTHANTQTHMYILYTSVQTHSIVYVLEAQTGTMSAEAASMHDLHTITNAHTLNCVSCARST